jgi:hypothetical protein
MKKIAMKIILFRLLFVIFILLIACLFLFGLNDYGIFISVLFLFMLIPTMTELQEFADHIVLRQYYFLTTIVKVHKIDRKSRLKITSFTTETEMDTDAYIQSETNWSFLPIIFTPKTYVKYYKFLYTENGIEKNVTVRLTDKEYKRIQNILTWGMYNP